MWEIFGQVFFNDPTRLVDNEHHTFRKDDIISLLTQQGIAIFDTAIAVRRQQGNASDKFLQVVEKTDIRQLLTQIPCCHDIVCTGQKASATLCDDYDIAVPTMGSFSAFTIEERPMRLWRMPSSSRAYPMPLAEKARYYRHMMTTVLS